MVVSMQLCRVLSRLRILDCCRPIALNVRSTSAACGTMLASKVASPTISAVLLASRALHQAYRSKGSANGALKGWRPWR